jgi:RNA polymerase sigma-54 factor
MILKDIADIVLMDISTISRVANSKHIQTPYGTYLLKYFFSEALMTDDGEEVSTRIIKQKIKELIDAESKSKPLSDDKLGKDLKKLGYNVARRTVAKYREQLRIPVARLRREL